MSRRRRRFACPFIAGVDEVGRGPLAGPVVAAAVMLPARGLPRGLTDSKLLTRNRREALDAKIRGRALAWAIGQASAAEIDAYNIRQASLLAMQRAVAALWMVPCAAWVDGDTPPRLPMPLRTVIGGDRLVPAISAAAIVAKVARDQQMRLLDMRYPGYGLAQHKGYATAGHRGALERHGVTPVHRRSFAPVTRQLQATRPLFDSAGDAAAGEVS